jgi:hypothetical protein
MVSIGKLSNGTRGIIRSPATTLSIAKRQPVADLFRFSDKGVDLYLSKESLRFQEQHIKQQIRFKQQHEYGCFGRTENDLMRSLVKLTDEQLTEYDPKILKYIEAFKSFHPDKKTAILVAHGGMSGMRSREWIFTGNTSTHSLQEWINRYEEEYSVIFIVCCNPGYISVSSRSALLVVPDSDVLALAKSSYGKNTCWTLHYLSFEISRMTLDWEMKFLNSLKKKKDPKRNFTAYFREGHYSNQSL